MSAGSPAFPRPPHAVCRPLCRRCRRCLRARLFAPSLPLRRLGRADDHVASSSHGAHPWSCVEPSPVEGSEGIDPPPDCGGLAARAQEVQTRREVSTLFPPGGWRPTLIDLSDAMPGHDQPAASRGAITAGRQVAVLISSVLLYRDHPLSPPARPALTGASRTDRSNTLRPFHRASSAATDGRIWAAAGWL